MKACTLFSLKNVLFLSCILILNGVSNVIARRITAVQVQKAPPDDMLLDRDYEVTEDDQTINKAIQYWTDRSPEWMDDGCINLEESGDDWLLQEITYNPARANPSHPYFLAGILVYNQYFCKGIPLLLRLGDFTDERDSEPGSPRIKPWEDPRNGEFEEGYQIVAGLRNRSQPNGEPNDEPWEFQLEIPEVLPDRDVPESLRTPLREDYADEDEFERETATRWHKASAWRGKQHIQDIADDMYWAGAEGAVEGTPESEGDELAGDGSDSFSQIREFGRDISSYGYWGAVSIKFVTDYSRWYTINLGDEVS
ncbi:hypothetical protein TWF718_001252 [Orbilia javanica]|uniref:Uncharacterized protein n=1 Tax=Orbilia javanica TaxID=47235 RepID=A0AAN8NHB1_9PEZI